MAKPNKDYQLIIMKYLENELSDDEKKSLEIEIQKNPELMNEFQLQTQLNDFLKGKFLAEKESSMTENLSNIQTGNTSIGKLAGDWVNEWEQEQKDKENNDELRDFISGGLKQVKEMDKQKQLSKPFINEKKTNKSTFNMKWIYTAALAAAIFVISISLLWFLDKDSSNSELYATYYQPYHFIQEQNRGSDTVIVSAINEATEAYQSKNYSKAAEIIRKVLSADNKQVKAHFLSALISVETGNYSRASEEFNLIINEFDTYHIESKWYLALCYLKLNQPKKTKELLKELSLSKNFYQNRALEMLGKM